MELSDELLCVFTAEVDKRNREYVIQIPDQEVEVGELQGGKVYRVGVFSQTTADGSTSTQPTGQEPEFPEPPVEEGETLEIEVEDTGEQGDGIARIEQGYIVFVPGTDFGDRATIEITDVRENFAFSEVVEGPY